MKKLLPILLVGLLVLSGLGAVALPGRYQKAEVQNVSENTSTVSYESRLETGESPYWLDGTILDGNTRVIVSEDGQPPEGTSPDDYDYVISYEEMDIICETARQDYIDKYGVDPCPPEPEPKGVPSLYAFDEVFVDERSTKADSPGSPHQINGKIIVDVFTAKDSGHRPNDPHYLAGESYTGFKKFQTFNVQTGGYGYYGYWDASDVGSNMNDILDDLIEDCDKYRHGAENQVLMGWVRDANPGSGLACQDGFWCVAKESSIFVKRLIAQHEISHLFNAPDHGYSPWPYCIMSYWWLFFGVNTWCGGCTNMIRSHIWQ